jgi:hypothetical protein
MALLLMRFSVPHDFILLHRFNFVNSKIKKKVKKNKKPPHFCDGKSEVNFI